MSHRTKPTGSLISQLSEKFVTRDCRCLMEFHTKVNKFYKGFRCSQWFSRNRKIPWQAFSPRFHPSPGSLTCFQTLSYASEPCKTNSKHSLTFDSQNPRDLCHITTGNSLHSCWRSDAIGMMTNWTSVPWVTRYIDVIWVTYHLQMCYNDILSTQDMLDHCAHQGLPASRLHRGAWLHTTDQCSCDIRPFWYKLHWMITAGTPIKNVPS